MILQGDRVDEHYDPAIYRVIGRAGVERVRPPIIGFMGEALIGILGGCLLAGGLLWWAGKLATLIDSILRF